jgi:rhodanese-related sulfurtransferase
MKKFFDLAFYPALALLIFQFFLRNPAEIEGKKAYGQMLSGKAVILDIREKDELSEGMIKGALWIPLSELAADKKATVQRVKSLANQKEIYIYCRSGKRADNFLSVIKEEGMKGLNLGGYSHLISEGLPSQSQP